MKFCSVCDNMLYITVTEDQKLCHYCKNCSYKHVADNGEGVELVSETIMNQDTASYKQYMTPYIKYDPTLPRVNNIKCHNSDCPTHKKGSDPEVIYIKYDHKNMYYLYFCCKCDHFWTKN